MVDFSIFFILLQYIVTFTQTQDGSYKHILVYIAGAAFILFEAIALILRISKKTRDASVRRAFSRFAFITFVVFILAGFSVVWPLVVEWGESTYNLRGNLFQLCAGGGLLLLVVLGTFIASRAFSEKPNNNSMLNIRQFLMTISVSTLIILVFFILYYISFDTFRTVLITLFIVTECLSILFWFYDPFIYILTQVFRKKRKPPCEPTPNKLNRFAVIGCAHNEEAVIGQLINSLHATTYPKNKYDIYVICDNCTDSTADIVRKNGAIAMERTDPDHRGKGFGLKWMFEILQQKREAGDAYDGYIVLDADNLVNEAYLDAINDKMNEGYEILQTYLGCKNPADTWISASYSYSYWVSNTIYQRAHSDIGLSAQMGGTGMVLRPTVLDEIGWDTDSLTEDLVLTVRYVKKKNLPCCWVHDAKLYDEKPLKLGLSIRQRTRWMQGHMDAMFKYVPSLLWSALKKMSIKQFDIAFYLSRPFLNLVMFLSYLIHIYVNLFLPGDFLSVSFIMSSNTSLLLMLGYFVLQFYVLACENHGKYIPSVLLQFPFSFTWYPSILRGMIKYKERYWVSTVHTRSLSIGDVREDVLLLEAKERLSGLDNLHRLPLGQILLKATAITKNQLDSALVHQSEHGGFLGDIIVDMNILTQESLNAYLSIQQTMKEQAEQEGSGSEHLRMGDLLLNAGVINQTQLDIALEYQKKHGGFLGESLIITKCIPVELLQIFLEVQKLFDVNYLSIRSAHVLINGVFSNTTENIGTLLCEGGLISKQQLEYALATQKEQYAPIGTILLDCGFINQETLDIILGLQKAGRAFFKKRQELTDQEALKELDALIEQVDALEQAEIAVEEEEGTK